MNKTYYGNTFLEMKSKDKQRQTQTLIFDERNKSFLHFKENVIHKLTERQFLTQFPRKKYLSQYIPTNIDQRELERITKRYKKNHNPYKEFTKQLERTISWYRNISMHTGDRDDQRDIQRFRSLKYKPEKLEKALEHIDVAQKRSDWQFENFYNRLCMQNFGACPEEFRWLITTNRKNLIQEYIERKDQKIQAIQDNKLPYLHKGQKEEIAQINRDFQLYDLLLLRDSILGDNDSKELRTNLQDNFLRQLPEDYAIFRNLQEGPIDNSTIREFVTKMAIQLERTTENEYIKIDDMRDTGLDAFGNGIGSFAVDILGRVFKKRKYVPALRIGTNFRKNYLFKNVEAKIQELINGGMAPGDIILEKDMKANTDVLIPGYWVHASIYLGTIKDFKEMGLWNTPEFALIQRDILKYQHNKDYKKNLTKKYKNTMKFEEIPWFIESDRPGVGAHPMHKFLGTDGMAVLRPNKMRWDKNAVIEHIKRANTYVDFAYDYNHSIRDQKKVTCSKYVLRVFDDITFPISENLDYITISPDQVGQGTGLGENGTGQLKLIMFFDHQAKGKMTYHHETMPNKSAFQEYLKASFNL